MKTRHRKLKILIVEDELSYREIYEEILSEQYDLSFALNLETAKNLVVEFQPAIAIIDMRLQNVLDNIDGLELAEYIHSANKSIVMILKSGFPVQSEKIQERINQAEVFKILDKSSDNQVEELLETIKQAEEKRQKTQPLKSFFRKIGS